jgi:hypothetical protein
LILRPKYYSCQNRQKFCPLQKDFCQPFKKSANFSFSFFLSGGLPRGKATTEQHYIFERPTLPPEPEDSNTALVSVFLLIILLIILSGAVWKLQLHKRLFRANYDTVAGG